MIKKNLWSRIVLEPEDENDEKRIKLLYHYLTAVKFPFFDRIEYDGKKIVFFRSGKRYASETEAKKLLLRLTKYGLFLLNPTRKDFELDRDGNVYLLSPEKLVLINNRRTVQKLVEVITELFLEE